LSHAAIGLSPALRWEVHTVTALACTEDMVTEILVLGMSFALVLPVLCKQMIFDIVDIF